MGTIRVVTDSTADLGAMLAAELGVTVIPLTVSFGDEVYQDGVTIDSRTFFEKLSHGRTHPTTSQPSPGAVEEIFHQLLRDGAEGIVCINVSSRLSGTYGTVVRAAENLREAGVTVPIEVIDSRQASLGMQFGVIAAAQAARAGADIATVATRARDALTRTVLLVVADDLEYLQRGGRIGQAQRVVGTLLNVKPIITLRDGIVVPVETPRTRRKAYERVAETLRETRTVESVIVGQSNEAMGNELDAALHQVYKGPVRRMWAGPTIGSHVGPGMVGIAILRASN